MVLSSASHLSPLPNITNWLSSLFFLYVVSQNALLKASLFEVGACKFLIVCRITITRWPLGPCIPFFTLRSLCSSFPFVTTTNSNVTFMTLRTWYLLWHLRDPETQYHHHQVALAHQDHPWGPVYQYLLCHSYLP